MTHVSTASAFHVDVKQSRGDCSLWHQLAMSTSDSGENSLAIAAPSGATLMQVVCLEDLNEVIHALVCSLTLVRHS